MDTSSARIYVNKLSSLVALPNGKCRNWPVEAMRSRPLLDNEYVYVAAVNLHYPLLSMYFQYISAVR